ncbi:MAG: YbaB/EbfC family nucleoid-associated protein [Firmicutes bacterium]|jgi:DNA-binding protein, ybaB/ebfC family|nr:YbaB/EbfC family nucleoid-associated protein [Bacillota bacterium]
MAYGGRGFGGGMNMQALMKQAQQMQEQLKKAQDELKESEFIGSAGGGMVNVTVSGAKEVLAVSIKPEAVDPDDIEMLEDLITAAVNDALNKVSEKERELMPNMGGLGL